MKIRILVFLLCCIAFYPVPSQTTTSQVIQKPIEPKKYSLQYFFRFKKKIDDSAAVRKIMNEEAKKEIRKQTDSLVAYYKKQFCKQKTPIQ